MEDKIDPCDCKSLHYLKKNSTGILLFFLSITITYKQISFIILNVGKIHEFLMNKCADQSPYTAVALETLIQLKRYIQFRVNS